MKLKFTYKGGKGSGHYDHEGRPGKHGGSLPGKDASSSRTVRSDNAEEEAARARDAQGLDKARFDKKLEQMHDQERRMDKYSKAGFGKKYPAVDEMIQAMSEEAGIKRLSKIDVDDALIKDIDRAEVVLNKLSGKKISDILSSDESWEEYGISDDDSAIEVFTNGGEDMQEKIVNFLGKDGRFVTDLMSEMFDGKYYESFFSLDD